MAKNTITLFMWGYQHSLRYEVESRTNNVLKELGVVAGGVECLLVGARRPGSNNANGVCVEPEDGKWSLGLFDGLLAAIEAQIAVRHRTRRQRLWPEGSSRCLGGPARMIPSG
jgi:hypothetical protein